MPRHKVGARKLTRLLLIPRLYSTPGAGVYRGRRETAKFAVFREISRNLPFSAKYREICSLSRNIAKFAVYRELSRKLPSAVFARVLKNCFKMSSFVSKCRTFQQLWFQVFQNVENVSECRDFSPH